MELESHLLRQKGEAPLLELPRGCRPQILLDHVNITMPYAWTELPSNPSTLRYIQLVKFARRFIEENGGELKLDHASYFELCVAAHYTSVGSFVPTDVDNQIRFRLWHPEASNETIEAMVDTVEEALGWDIRPVTTRWIPDPNSTQILSGHRGEWLTISSAAYGALRKRNPKRATHIYHLIQEEIAFETSVYKAFREKGDGVSLLKASALIAHNMGDLLRVIDMWNLAEDDALRLAYNRAMSKDFENGLLIESGELYKLLLSADNHRHFALRAAKGLRKSADFLVPIGPFFDDWGKRVARHPLLSEMEIGEVAEALIDGWVKLTYPVGYARALSGMENALPGGAGTLAKLLPSRLSKTLRTGLLRQQCDFTQDRFENQYSQRAMKFVREFRR